MSYDLSIHLVESGVSPGRVSSFLDQYPGAKPSGDRAWILAPTPAVHVEIDVYPATDAADTHVEAIGVGIPYPYLTASGEPALRLCFELANEFGGRVYDEQSGDYIDPARMDKVLDGLVAYGAAADAALPSVAWIDAWTAAATRQRLPVLAGILLIAMLGAVGMVFWLEVPDGRVERYLFGIGAIIAVLLFTAKIGIDVWRNRRG